MHYNIDRKNFACKFRKKSTLLLCSTVWCMAFTPLVVPLICMAAVVQEQLYGAVLGMESTYQSSLFHNCHFLWLAIQSSRQTGVSDFSSDTIAERRLAVWRALHKLSMTPLIATLHSLLVTRVEPPSCLLMTGRTSLLHIWRRWPALRSTITFGLTPPSVFVKEHADSEEETINLMKFTPPWAPDPTVLSSLVLPKGLSAERQWYLYESIRPFCPDRDKDTTCPLPDVPRPGSVPGTPVSRPQPKQKRQNLLQNANVCVVPAGKKGITAVHVQTEEG